MSEVFDILCGRGLVNLGTEHWFSNPEVTNANPEIFRSQTIMDDDKSKGRIRNLTVMVCLFVKHSRCMCLAKHTTTRIILLFDSDCVCPEYRSMSVRWQFDQCVMVAETWCEQTSLSSYFWHPCIVLLKQYLMINISLIITLNAEPFSVYK